MAKITINENSLKPRREFKRHPIQPGHNILRILPPFGDETVNSNYPYKRWSLAWFIDPTTGRKKPFALPAYKKDDPDPVSAYTKLLADKLDRVKKTAIDSLINQGVDQVKAEGIVREKLVDASKLVWEIRPKQAFYYNAVNKAGEVGILELKKTAHDALKAEMYQYIKDYSQDPTSLFSEVDDSGLWFDIERVGEKGDKNTEYKVKKNQTKRKNERGILTFEDDREALPDHVVANYATQGYDVYNLYQEKTHEELYAILMFNLKDIVATVPLARIEGFDPDQFDFGVVKQDASKNEEKPIVKGKVPVKLAMVDEEDLEVDLSVSTADMPPVEFVPVTKELQLKPTVTLNKQTLSNDDIVAMAESFLNS